MDYRVFAIDELQRVNQLYAAERNIKSRIAEIDSRMKSVNSGGTGTSGGRGDNKTEHKLLSLIASKDDEKNRLREVLRGIKRVEDSLATLTDAERKVLQALYVEGRSANELAAAEYSSRSTIYRIRDDALIKFTRAMFGAVIT